MRDCIRGHGANRLRKDGKAVVKRAYRIAATGPCGCPMRSSSTGETRGEGGALRIAAGSDTTLRDGSIRADVQTGPIHDAEVSGRMIRTAGADPSHIGSRLGARICEPRTQVSWGLTNAILQIRGRTARAWGRGLT